MTSIHSILEQYNIYFSFEYNVEDFVMAVAALAKNRIPLTRLVKELQEPAERYNNLISNNKIRSIVKNIYMSSDDYKNPKEYLEIALGDDGAVKDIIEYIESYKEQPFVNIPFYEKDMTIYLDHQNKQVKLIKTVVVKGVTFEEEMSVIDAIPTKINLYESPLPGDIRQIKIQWDTITNKFTIGPGPIQAQYDFLEESGRVLYSRYLKDVLAAIISESVRRGFSKIKEQVESPGIYYDEVRNKIVTVKYEKSKVTPESIQDCIKLLENLAKYVKDPTKLATVIKWNMLAPFAYAMKIMGAPMFPYLYLYGVAGTGKTTMACIGQYVHTYPTSETNTGGSSFDTVARIGEKLRQSTFPIIVNEPKSTFDRPSTAEMVKVAIESTIARGRFEGRVFRNIPSLSPIMFTSNHYLPPDDALLRRLHIINFTHADKPSKEEMQEFQNAFRVNNPHTSPLRQLNVLGSFVLEEVESDIKLLYDDYKSVADSLILRFYSDAGMEPPEWILEWSEAEGGYSEMEEDIREEIRVFICDLINEKMAKTRWTNEYDTVISKDALPVEEEGYFDEMVYNVLKSGKIPYILLHHNGQYDEVVCTSGFRSELRKRRDMSMSLKGISDLMGDGWDYKAVRFGNAVKKCVVVPFHDFVEFLKPF